MDNINITPTPEDIARVKGLGFLRDKRFDNIFNARVITHGGKITTAELRAIADAADRFGSGEVAMTTRLSAEIQGIAYDNIPALIDFLAEHGLEVGGTGPKVRPVVSCKGTTCTFGLIDTYSLTLKIHERFYKGYHNEVLPHKFKIAVGGCPNNCVKPDLNDIGVIGQRIVAVNRDSCRRCAKCVIEATCPIKAASVENGKLCIDREVCTSCGRCYKKCPFGVTDEAAVGYKLTLGGRWGKKTAVGRPLTRLLFSEEEVLDVIERALTLFRDEGIKGERFADTVARLGFDYVESRLMH